MARIKWDESGEHLFETGVNQGVLYKITDNEYANGYVWNGLTGVSESPSGADATALWADDIKYLNLIASEEFKATVEAYTYPEEFEECDGSASIATGVVIGQQARVPFGLSYKTTLGNDTEGTSYGYKLHMIYGCSASPSAKSYETINDSPSAITFSWEVNTTPVPVTGHKNTATVVIDSTKVDAGNLAILETVLYGGDFAAFSASKTYAVGDTVTEATKKYVCVEAVTTPGVFDEDKWYEMDTEGGVAPGPRLPMPDEIKSIFGIEL